MISNAVSLYAVQAINYSTSLASIPLLVSGLGLQGYGQYSVYFAVSVLSGVLIEFGSGYQAVPEVARGRGARRVGYVWSSLLSLELVIVAVATVVTCAVHATGMLPGTTSVMLLLVALLIGAFNSLSFAAIQLGLGRSAALLLPTVLSRGGFVAYLLAERDSVTVTGALVAYMLCTSLLCAGSNWSLARHLGRFPTVRASLAYRRARRASSYFGVAALGALYANTNILLLSAFAGDAQVGLYSVAEKLRNALNGVLQPLGLALFYEAASGRHSRGKRIAFACAQVGAVLGAVVLAIALAPIGVEYLSGVRPAASGTLLLLMMVAIVPTQMRSMLNLQVLVVGGRSTAVVVQAGCVLMTHLLLVALLVPRFEATGMASSVLIVETGALLATAAWVMLRARSPSGLRPRPKPSAR